ncbi:MAG TPA: hypothetical protein VIK91_09725 [Nannocystis sp.]
MRRAGLVLLCLAACAGGDLEGRLSVRSDEYGSWTMSPTTCYSGEHQGFFGVDLTEDGDTSRGVRIVLDPIDGYLLRLNVPERDIALVLGESTSSCEAFEVHVERTNTRINNIWVVEGHAFVKCRTPTTEIDADLEFSGCA